MFDSNYSRLNSDSRFVSKLSSHSSCSGIQFSIMLCSDAPLTVHLVGQWTRKPGALGANSAFNFSNILSRFGEYFSNFDILLVVSMHLVSSSLPLPYHQLLTVESVHNSEKGWHGVPFLDLCCYARLRTNHIVRAVITLSWAVLN